MLVKMQMNSAAKVSQPLRCLDERPAIKKLPGELKPFLEEANAPNS